MDLERSIGIELADSSSSAPPSGPATDGMIQLIGGPEITSPLVSSYDEGVVLAGRSNGEVVLFSIGSAEKIPVLYRYDVGASVISIALDASRGCVASADDAGRVLVVQATGRLSNLGAEKPIITLDQSVGESISEVLLSPATDHVLVCGRHNVQVWKIPFTKMAYSGDAHQRIRSRPSEVLSRSVFLHPTNKAWYVVVAEKNARVYSWEDSLELSDYGGVLKENLDVKLRDTENKSVLADFTPNSTYHVGPDFVVEHTKSSSASPACLRVWPALVFDPSLSEGAAHPLDEPNMDSIGPAVLQVLGISGSTVVFLDVNLWVCTVELQSVREQSSDSPIGLDGAAKSESTLSLPVSSRRQPATAHAQRHFFALNEWRTTRGDLFGTLLACPTKATQTRGGNWARDAVVFSQGSGIVVIEGGLAFSERLVMSASVA